MIIAKDLKNVLFSFGVVLLTLSIGAYTYYAQPTFPEDLSATSISDPDSMDDWTFTQTEIDNPVTPVSSSTESLDTKPTTTEPVVPVPVKTNTQFSDAIAKQIADQKAAEDKAAADALAAKIAADQLAAEKAAQDKAAADALAAKIAADQLAAEKAAADAAAAAKKSRKSRAS
jgi:hypothetical protein